MTSLPVGWEDRSNSMSEHDMALGGSAATRFSRRKGAYEDTSSAAFQSSDQVRQHYLNQPGSMGSWAEREKVRAVEASMYNSSTPKDTATSSGTGSATSQNPVTSNATTALVQVATHNLNALSKVLEDTERDSISIPVALREEFANAVKRAVSSMAGAR